jgi:hypothetical protein
MSTITKRDSHSETPVAGVIGSYSGSNTTIITLIVFFAGLTFYNALELLILIFITFKQRKGLYFWSLLVSTTGLIPYAVGFLLKLLGIPLGQARWTSLVLLTVGWWTMITGQSVVLWSRLHLVLSPGPRNDMLLRWTKWMIIVDAVVLHLSTTAVTLGSNVSVDEGMSARTRQNFLSAYNVIEKFQMTAFW